MKAGCFSSLLIVWAVAARAQGTFGNLDFESANVPSAPYPSAVYEPTSRLFPGWTAYVGDRQLTDSYYQATGLGTAGVFLLGPTGAEDYIFQGSYAVRLFGAQDGFGGPLAGASIAQSGTVPLNAKSLLFFASSTDLQVSFNGQSLNTIPVQVWSSLYTEYGVDVSSLAGTSGELRFSVGPPAFPGGATGSFLDTILFSPTPVPEPTALTLLGCGIVAGLLRKGLTSR